MTTFDNKEKAEENKYAHDQELEFRIYARYHSLLADWVAETLKLDAAQKDGYKKVLVTSVLGNHDQATLFGKIRQDFLTHNVLIKDHDLQQKMHDIMQAAKKQLAGK